LSARTAEKLRGERRTTPQLRLSRRLDSANVCCRRQTPRGRARPLGGWLGLDCADVAAADDVTNRGGWAGPCHRSQGRWLVDCTPVRGLVSLVALAAVSMSAASCRTTAPAKPPVQLPARAAVPRPAPKDPATRTPKEDCEALLNFVVPFAKEMLQKKRAFYPFAATVAPDGVIDGMMAGTGDAHPDVNQLIFMLDLGLRQGAGEGKYKATAMVIDMIVVPPGKTAKQDGVAVRIDHRDGTSIVVGLPYTFSSAGELVMETPFFNEGAHQVFPAPGK
jgi:hypothetical protein